jgi:hypothetical protein
MCAGPIRAWRAGESKAAGLKVVKPPKARKTKDAKAVGKNKPVTKIAKNEICKSNLQRIAVKHELKLDDRQKVKFDNLFLAPKALASLLRVHPEVLNTAMDASLFMLRYKKDLDGFINPATRETQINFLHELLIRWSKNPLDPIGFDFDSGSITPEQEIVLPLRGLGLVQVRLPKQLAREREGRHYVERFTLTNEASKFFVEFTLEIKRWSKAQKLTPSENLRKLPNPPEIILQKGKPLPYIVGPREVPASSERRVLYSRYSGIFKGGIKTMNWTDLSGRGIQGGLPYSGKRR